MSKTILTVAGLVATLAAGVVGALPASAQDWHHDWQGGWHHHARPFRHLAHLHQAYARDVAEGHYGAAERAHLHAQMIRHHLREHQDEHQDWHNGY